MISIDNQTISGTFDNNPELDEYIKKLKKYGTINKLSVWYEGDFLPRFEMDYTPYEFIDIKIYNKGE